MIMNLKMKQFFKYYRRITKLDLDLEIFLLFKLSTVFT